MIRTSALAIALGLFLAGCGGSGTGSDPSEPAADAPAAWTTLFDGSSLDGWTPIGDANWRLVDGVVEADGGSGFLVSNQSYENFELLVEFWITDDGNSGVFIRCADPQNVTSVNSYEVNVFDQRPDPIYRTGGIVDLASPTSTVDAGGRWNTFEITANGPRLIVRLNGITTVDVEDEKHPRGPFALQYAAGTVRFRNVQIRPIADPAPAGME